MRIGSIFKVLTSFSNWHDARTDKRHFSKMQLGWGSNMLWEAISLCRILEFIVSKGRQNSKAQDDTPHLGFLQIVADVSGKQNTNLPQQNYALMPISKETHIWHTNKSICTLQRYARWVDTNMIGSIWRHLEREAYDRREAFSYLDNQEAAGGSA